MLASRVAPETAKALSVGAGWLGGGDAGEEDRSWSGFFFWTSTICRLRVVVGDADAEFAR